MSCDQNTLPACRHSIVVPAANSQLLCYKLRKVVFLFQLDSSFLELRIKNYELRAYV